VPREEIEFFYPQGKDPIARRGSTQKKQRGIRPGLDFLHFEKEGLLGQKEKRETSRVLTQKGEKGGIGLFPKGLPTASLRLALSSRSRPKEGKELFNVQRWQKGGKWPVAGGGSDQRGLRGAGGRRAVLQRGERLVQIGKKRGVGQKEKSGGPPARAYTQILFFSVTPGEEERARQKARVCADGRESGSRQGRRLVLEGGGKKLGASPNPKEKKRLPAGGKKKGPVYHTRAPSRGPPTLYWNPLPPLAKKMGGEPPPTMSYEGAGGETPFPLMRGGNVRSF